MKNLKLTAAILGASALLSPAALAHDGDGGNVTYATDHAPIGVMADHRHKKGEVMLSYRYMLMDMEGNRDGTDTLTSDQIATSVPNRFANPPMMPPTLRVVPEEMKMHMHMVGAMYGLSDRITLMGMASYITKDMDHTTYMGGMGTNVLGEFTTESAGFGDTTIAAIIGLDDGSKSHSQFNLTLGLSLPTGSIEETDQILTPMNATPTPRLPYAMQLGSGTFDFKPNLTYRTRRNDWSLGGQISGVVRIGENDEDYALGDVLAATAWAAYEFTPSFSLSGRIKAMSQGQIDGIDANIAAPVQTADPLNYGGEQIEALIGVNLAGQSGWMKGHRLAAEIGLPLYRDLNGPQLETDMTLTIGWQKAY